MNTLILIVIASVALAAPQYKYGPQSVSRSRADESSVQIPILRDDRVREDDGSYNFDVETANGIVLSQSGGSDGHKQGVISFTHPDGSDFHLTFVADENGFQPQSDALPVAPVFPHPIPDFVLEQIEFARQQDEAAAREAKSSVRTPSSRYEANFRRKRNVPAYGYSAPRTATSAGQMNNIPILKNDLIQEDDGTHNFEVETGNGIVISQSGGSDGHKQGVISFTHPDGTPFHMTFVADENGFQPQSDALPVAPVFPHPIPEFVLQQIEFARQQDEAVARETKSSFRTPSSRYEANFRRKRNVPAYDYSAPRTAASAGQMNNIPILRNDLIQEVDGTHNFEVETGNGIVISQSGGSDGHKQGVISFTHPDGTPFHMSFVADENGFQPQSDALPVAPIFPHPIPEFVLEQIEFARQQDEAAAREAKSSVRTPSSQYSVDRLQ